ncbi:efflux RND transporter periplasmic adaptor subunit [Thermophagus xiamenensis]|uniref:RND family efflux transporter, MFP subunit n=1 Tax=Thermophagus xiamenensis TaxID=385682 RepID=A0A1I2DKE8_9BACT|nr:efflux RND transporter periplasmic adaptor subunit [Thermophagus xiamenensis]SFE81112.1 RND family efflux transporter, MFP subunit [Thermophagus xiamenensis]
MRVLVCLVSLTTLLLFNSGCANHKPEENKVIRYVKVTEVESVSDVGERSFNAVIKEKRESSVSFRVGGTVEEIFFDEGDYVKAGTLLARLDQRDYKTMLTAAEAQYRQAKGELERYTQLYKQNKLPANTYEKIETAFMAAKSNWEKARNALADTRLTAPFSGFVFDKLINNHEVVGPGQPAFILIDTNTLEVSFGVPESIVNELSVGQEVEVTVNASEERYPATIKSVSHKAGGDRLFTVRLDMENPDVTKIKPGMTAKVFIPRINETGHKDIVLVPAEAIFYLGDQTYVWVYDSNTQSVVRRKVIAGKIAVSGRIEILNGLNVGEKIVVAGVHSLEEGQKVKPL